MKLGEFSTTVELHDLGEYDERWRGILSPLYDEAFVSKYIHSQFLENSGTYIEKYENLDYWRALLHSALRYCPFGTDERLRILDLGSGGGNTVFPLMDIFPSAQIVASDLSLPLLKALKTYRDKTDASERCFVLQLNAEELIFEPGTIDLVVGGAVLHHLFDPLKTIKQCHSALRLGGVALFFEPFEVGNLTMALLCRSLVELNEIRKTGPGTTGSGLPGFLRRRQREAANQLIPAEITAFFRGYSDDLESRKGADKTDPRFQHMDDKWLFTQEIIAGAKAAAGFRESLVFPLATVFEHMFENQIDVLLRLGIDSSILALPEWARGRIRQWDSHFSEGARKELLIEGGIVLTK